MEEDQIVDRFLKDIVFLEAVGINPVLVHGGGKVITTRMRSPTRQSPAAEFLSALAPTDPVQQAWR
jgi:acetylglutamate kinase